MNDVFTLVVFGLSVIGACVSCASAVIAYQNARKPVSSELQSHVDELASIVEKIFKAQTKERMSRVRNASRDIGNPPATSGDSGMLAEQPTAQGNIKDILRAQLRAQRGL